MAPERRTAWGTAAAFGGRERVNDTLSGRLAPAAAEAARPRFQARGRLFRKYVALFVAVVAVALVANGGFEIWFSYRDHEASLIRLQREQAAAAAARIGAFVTEIQSELGWTTELPWSATTLDQRRFDALRLLHQVPAITELSQLDAAGHEQLRVSRLELDAVGSNTDYSHDPRFTEAMAHKVYFGPVYFRRESEPYMTLALAGARKDAGVSVAEVNLKFIWDVVSQIKVGEHGFAFVVDGNGRIIADPDISLVLRDTNLASLPQVRAARAAIAGAQPHEITVARDMSGHRVLSAYAPIEPLRWLVFVELPLAEAYAPLYASIARAGGLLAGCLVLAFLAGLFLARRMVGPIQAIRAGAARVGGGDLTQRIAIKTGDELEALADQFNDMTGRLQESYANLERKVEDRTHELSQALEQQTATSDILRVIASTPGDPKRALDTIAQTAVRMFDAANVGIRRVDGDMLRFVATAGPASGVMRSKMLEVPLQSSDYLARSVLENRQFHTADIQADIPDWLPELKEVLLELGFRTAAFSPLTQDGKAIGAMAVNRTEVRPFRPDELELMKGFADQAVIAIENARLLTELRESLDRQTATADVLRVISSSPGALEPVFDAVLANAMRICGANFGGLYRFDGEWATTVASCGIDSDSEWMKFVRNRGKWRPTTENRMGQAMVTGKTVHVRDLRAEEGSDTYGSRSVAVNAAGMRTVLAVPMLKDKEVVGAIGVFHREVRPFTDKQIELIENFAAQAVIAIENARLLAELRTRTDELTESLDRQTATSEVLSTISASPGDLMPVFETMLDNATRICEATQGGLWRIESGALYREAERHQPAVAAAFTQGFVPPPESAPGRMLAAKATCHIADLVSLTDPASNTVVTVGGIRTALWVPMMRDQTIVGAFSLGRDEVRPFTDKQIALVESFAAQAVIAIENARLLTELRQRTADLQESLDYQTATSDVLKVISRSTFDLDPVLQTVVTTAVRLCRAEYAVIFRNYGEDYRWAAGHGLLPEYDRIERVTRIRPGPGTVIGRAALEGRTVQIADAWTDPLYEAKAEARAGNVRSMLGVPLMRENTVIGVIGLARGTLEPFREREIQLVTTFADQAVIAIENARLFGELRARTDDLAQSVEELKALGEVSQVVNSTLELQTVLTTIVTTAVEISATDAGAIYVFDETAQAFHLRATHGMDAAMIEAIERQRIDVGLSVIGDAAARRAPVQIADLSAEPANPITDIILRAGFRALLVMPLLRPDRIVGALVVRRRAPGEFPRATVDLLQTFAAQSVIAIQNARLFHEIEEKGRELAVASQHKSQFLANMSHELRTPMNAILGYTELILDDIYGAAPPKMRDVLVRVQANGKHLLGLINDVLDLSKIEAGQLSLTLAPYSIKELVQGVYVAVEPLAGMKNLALKLDVAANLPPAHGDERRIAQVLLNLVGNAIKFTDAGEVVIGARAADGALTVAVRDTGPGIAASDQAKIFEEFQQADNSSTRAKGGTGLGLAISRRIVEMHGGRLWVESAPGAGSTFFFTLPIFVERQGMSA
jgi:GAF domain-containing protein/HAMP domain-containing protein